MEPAVLFDLDDTGIATITLNRPEMRNPISGDDVVNGLCDTLAAMEGNPKVRVAILTGAGKAFSSGGDINAMKPGGGGLNAGLDDFAMDLEGNEPGAATEDPILQRLIFKTGKEGIATGLGFMPGTEAEVWLFSAHIFLGYATVKADGTFEKVFDVPTGIDLGDHTIQAEGTARSGGDRAISAGVVISDDPKVAKRKPITKRVVIPFERNSAVLTPGATTPANSVSTVPTSRPACVCHSHAHPLTCS
mgnify:CR=1 FL=1